MSTNPTPAAAPVVSAPVETASGPVNPMTLSDADLGSRYVPEALRDAESSAEPTVVFARSADTPTAPVVAADAVPQADGAPAADVPAEKPAEAPAAEIAPLATTFGVFDKEGELEIPRDLEISFKAGGKDLKLPLDRVVRMAQSAPQAEQYRQAAEELPQVKQYAEKIEQSYQQLQQELQQNNAIYERLLQDPDLYVQAVQAWQQQNSPEVRATRAEQEVAALRQQQQESATQSRVQQQSAEAYQYAATRIAPAVESMATKYPTLDPAEITAQFHVLTAPLLEAKPGGGVWVPPNKLPQVEALVTSDMDSWAQALHTKRNAATTAQTTQSQAAITQAQTTAQLAKRQLARAAAPALTAPSPDVARQKPIKTSGDAVEASLAKVREMVRGAT